MMRNICGYEASDHYVTIADQCPCRKTSPRPQSEVSARMQQ
jgi:hypothetical protein